MLLIINPETNISNWIKLYLPYQIRKQRLVNYKTNTKTNKIYWNYETFHDKFFEAFRSGCEIETKVYNKSKKLPVHSPSKILTTYKCNT